jgi:hypothetical protein
LGPISCKTNLAIASFIMVQMYYVDRYCFFFGNY